MACAPERGWCTWLRLESDTTGATCEVKTLTRKFCSEERGIQTNAMLNFVKVIVSSYLLALFQMNPNCLSSFSLPSILMLGLVAR